MIPHCGTEDRTVTTGDLRAELQHYATKADLAQMETRIIKWLVGIMLTSIAINSTIAFAMARLVN